MMFLFERKLKAGACLLLLAFLLFGCVNISKNEIKESEKFVHEIKQIIEKKKKDASVKEIEGRIFAGRKAKDVIQIKNVLIEDFIRVVFSEVLKQPYVMDRAIERLNKRIDVEIKKSSKSKNLFSVVVVLLEKSGIEIEEVDGVILMTVRVDQNIQVPGQGVSNSTQNQDQGGKINEAKNVTKSNFRSVPADCVFTYQPIYARAVDIQKTLSGVLQNENSKIIISEQANKIIFRSTDTERRAIVKLLRDLDERQKQIYVDVTLAEITLTGDLSIGLEGFLKSDSLKIGTGVNIINDIGLNGTLIIGDWLKAVLQLGEKKGIIKIRSNPYLTIADGAESSIEIGAEIPSLASQKSSGDTSVLSQIEYKKTGILLSMKPVISGDSVHLIASVELSEAQQNTFSTIQSPSILTRKIKSDVVLVSGQSLIIGGLVTESKSNNDSFFPGGKYSLLTSRNASSTRNEIVVIFDVSILKEKDDEWFERLVEKYENQKIERKRK